MLNENLITLFILYKYYKVQASMGIWLHQTNIMYYIKQRERFFINAFLNEYDKVKSEIKNTRTIKMSSFFYGF